MQPDTDVKSLMIRYQQGDRAAASALVERLSPPLHRFFLMQPVSRRYADDLLQETWMRVHQARHTYRPGEPVLPWLYAIARHVRVDHYRRTRRFETREQQVDRLPEIAGHEPPGGAAGADLSAILQALPESQREVIAMLKVLNMSLEEVARATSSSIGAVKQKAHRAYATLRERLAGERSGS